MHAGTVPIVEQIHPVGAGAAAQRPRNCVQPLLCMPPGGAFKPMPQLLQACMRSPPHREVLDARCNLKVSGERGRAVHALMAA